MNTLKNKKVFAFGDSIVYGHTAPELAFLPLLQKEMGFELTQCAVNGATIIYKGDKPIIDQVKNLKTEASPDYIVFDGYTNDAYKGVEENMGTLSETGTEVFDNKTFYGAFEEIVYNMKLRWPDAKYLFVTIHKSAARNWEIQQLLRSAAIDVCNKWDIAVVDMFRDTDLDTRDPEQMARYIMEGAGSHPNVNACEKFYCPMVKKALESL